MVPKDLCYRCSQTLQFSNTFSSQENEMYDLNYTFSNDNHNTSYLKIKKARLDHSGVYVCRASAGTLAPKGHEALALGRLANPIFISVYCEFILPFVLVFIVSIYYLFSVYCKYLLLVY